MTIKGFWHIYMINHWYSIVMDQMRILLTSGLYDECEEISIGCIGDPEAKAKLEHFIVSLYPKLKIKYFSSRAEDFEFPTLKLICADKTPFVGFYFHTKAVTRPDDLMQNHWRAWMNEMILNRWQPHRRRVEGDYVTSSVNYLKSPDHFSGNFWWFNREYIDTLPKIESLDHNYRWHAEQWICMGKGRLFAEDYFDISKDKFTIQCK